MSKNLGMHSKNRLVQCVTSILKLNRLIMFSCVVFFFVIKTMKFLASFNEIVFQRKKKSLVSLVLLSPDRFPKM